jgi:hypothetical protein
VELLKTVLHGDNSFAYLLELIQGSNIRRMCGGGIALQFWSMDSPMNGYLQELSINCRKFWNNIAIVGNPNGKMVNCISPSQAPQNVI